MMDIINTIQSNILSPLILFFLLGIIAVRLKSDLKIPENITTIISLYLLMSIGLHGGLEIRKAGLDTIIIPIIVSVGVCILITINHYNILRRLKFNIFDSSALAATYGSVSVATFSVGVSYLNSQGIVTEGYLAAILAILESVGLIVGILLANLAISKTKREKIKSLKKNLSVDDSDSKDTYKNSKYTNDGNNKNLVSTKNDVLMSNLNEKIDENRGESYHSTNLGFTRIIKETLTGQAILVLMGSIFIGYVIGENGFTSIKIVFEDAFRGALVIYLLEMGVIAGQKLGSIKNAGFPLIIFAILIPQFNAIIGVIIGTIIGISMGGSILFGLLLGSASYIAAPAVLRNAIPQANPSLYITSALGITFPYNVIINLPILISLSTMIHESTFFSDILSLNLWGS